MAFWNKLFKNNLDRNDNESQLSTKDRFKALKNLPAFFKLIWETHRGMFMANVLLRLVRSAFPVLLLYIGKLIIDEVVQLVQTSGDHDLKYLFELVALEFGLAILSDVFNRIVTLLDSLLGDLVANKSSVNLMRHAGTLDLDQFEDSSFYDKLERARQQTVRRTVLMTQVLTQMQSLITIGFLIVGLVALAPWLIILLIIAIIPAFWGETHFNERSYSLSRQWTPQRRELDYYRYIGASDETAKEIKMFGLSDFISNHFKSLADQYYGENKKIAVARSYWGSLFAAIGSIGYYIAYVLIILKTVNGEISVGDLTFLAGSFSRLRGLMEGVLNSFSSVAEGALYLQDFFDFFKIQPKIISNPDVRVVPNPIRQGFVFENVGFRYRNAEKWAVRNLSFTLQAGEKLALVGENGAGKTTIAKLLARLYDPVEGRILLDGYDLREYDPASLRNEIGVIFQDFVRYQMTVSRNIAVGKIEELNNTERISKAAVQSLANQVIEKLPNRFDQVIGKRFAEGVDLSGGEWQKLAIGRAYMRDAQVLALDEPTAALDARAEYEVFQRFINLTKGKTTLLISHRFSTVRMADRILVLDKGKCLEIGTHEELIAKKGKYAELFELQAQGYK